MARDEQGIGHMHFFAELADIDRRVDRQADKMRLPMFLMQGFEVGHFLDARRTPGRPEVQDQRLAKILAQIHLPVVQIGKRSEEHTSELQSLMRISYAVFCLKKKNKST